MDIKTVNQIAEILETIKKENITEEKKISVKNNDYIVIHLSGNYQPSITIVKSSEFNNYFSEDNGFEVGDIKKLKRLEGGQTDSSLEDIIVVKM
jgi:hypothetical protein|tara:strand:+ start:501 stop:782 length:282 start_codon:yes stop_codon:yes gene_type:complete